MLQRRTRLEHTAAQLSGHCCREQVGGSAGISCAVTKIDGACPNAQLHFFFFSYYTFILINRSQTLNHFLLIFLPLSDVLAVACQDRMLSVFSSCGRRLLPAIQLATPVSALHCSAHFVMVLTAGATLSVWSVVIYSVVMWNVMWWILLDLICSK